MKKTSIKNLMYRDLLMIHKRIIIDFFVMLLLTIIGILLQLSLNFGNLGKIPDAYHEIKEVLPIVIIFPVLIAAFFLPVNSCESIVKETIPVWNKYRLSLPVSGLRFALSRYLCEICILLFSLVYVFLYMYIISALGNTAVNVSIINLAVIGCLFFMMFGWIMQTSMFFFKSTDKGGLVSALIVFLPLLIFMSTRQTPETESASISIKQILQMLDKISQFSVYIIIGFLLTGLVTFFATVFLYERRDK